jgi:hypothetical protein
MLTLKIPHKTDITEINSIRQKQSSVYRIAYKLACKGYSEKEIRQKIKTMSNLELDSWFIQSAIYKAIGQYKSELELQKLNPLLKIGKRIFGGKNNFVRRCKGLITKEEFKSKRLEKLYSIGQSSNYGNRKLDLNSDHLIVKINKNLHLKLDLPNLKRKYKKYYDLLVIACHNKQIPVTYQLDEKYIYLNFDETKLIDVPKPKVVKGRYLGIDLNPNYIGVSFYDETKNLLDTRLYNFSKLTTKNYNPNKLKHELREVAIQIGKIANHYQIEYFFVEDLSFKQGNKNKGKKFNRLTTNQFLINEFNRMLNKFGKIISVNAAYSSTIGNIVNSNYPDPIASSMEIARRGIESRIVKGSKLFYPIMVSKSVLENLWKKSLDKEFDTWYNLHNWIKSTGLKYRVPIPSIDMFRHFSSANSCVGVI